jgi:RNA polymerase sigma-70 factor, ECF subfamily
MASKRFSDWTDSQLLLEYASRFSEDAFAELHDRHGKELRVFVERSFGLDGNEADDVLQAVWLRVAEKSRQPIINFPGWIRTVAEGAVKDYLRSTDRLSNREASLEPQEAISIHSPLDDLVYSEDSAAIEASIRMLEPEQRMAILAVYSDGLTLAEAASRSGLPATTVWRHLDKAREKIKSQVA